MKTMTIAVRWSTKKGHGLRDEDGGLIKLEI